MASGGARADWNMCKEGAQGAAVAAVTVVIVNYNAGPLLAACVTAVRPQVRRVVIVDNASDDGSLDRLPAGVDVVVIRQSTNVGFAAACNAGIRAAGDDHVLLLNPDCEPAPDAVQRLTEVLAADAEAGLVGPLLGNPDGSEQRGGRRALPTPGRALIRASGLAPLARRVAGRAVGVDHDHEPLPAQPTPVEAISGACMLARAEALVAVGPLDEAYFMHCEDLDWCQRFRLAGWRVVFTPRAVVIHRKGSCSRDQPVFVDWHKHRGMLIYYRKFFAGNYPAPLLWLVTIAVWGRFAALLPRRLLQGWRAARRHHGTP